MYSVGNIAIVSFFIAPVVAVFLGIWSARRYANASWLEVYLVSAVLFFGLTSAAYFVLASLDWYLLDRDQTAIMAQGVVTEVTPKGNKTEYEVQLPQGRWARVVRFDYAPPIEQILQAGGVMGILLGFVVLVARWIARLCGVHSVASEQPGGGNVVQCDDG